MHHHTERIAHTTAVVIPVVEHWLEREIAQWVRPMKDRSDDPWHHERTLLPQSYISLVVESEKRVVAVDLNSSGFGPVTYCCSCSVFCSGPDC